MGRVVAPVVAGGSTDTLARLVAKVAPKYISQPIIVVNKPGGSEIVGREYVVNAKPDGYTLLIGFGGGQELVFPHTMKIPYGDPFKVFQPICMLSRHPYVLTIPASSPYKTLDEFIEGSRKKADITVGVAGRGGVADLTAQVVCRGFGIKALSLGFNGGAEVVINTVGGQVDAGLAHPSEIIQHVRTGRLRPLAITVKQRISDMPDVPTIFEKGATTPEFAAIKGIAAPKGTPKEVLSYLEEKFKLISKDPEFVEGMKKVVQPIVWMGSEEFSQYLHGMADHYYDYLKKLDMIK